MIINKTLGLKGAGVDTAELDELTYLLESGSDRIGALDFQHSPTEYIPRSANNVSMEALIESAERVEQGIPLAPEDDHLRAKIAHNKLHFFRRQHCIDRIDHGARAGNRVIADHPFHRVSRVKCNNIPRRHPDRCQPRRGPLNPFMSL